MIRSAILLVLLASLGGCGSGRPGTATKYRPAALFGGYKQSEIEPGIWKVSARSNGIAEPGFSQNMAVYRAAEILQGAGFSHMQVLDQRGKVGMFGVNGPPTNRGGEDFMVIVRGAGNGVAPQDCRAKRADSCFTWEIAPVMARVRPLLHIDE